MFPATSGGVCSYDHRMQLRYTFRLYPEPGQRIALARAFGCARVVFNDAVRAREDARVANKPYPGAAVLSRQLITRAKNTPERSWLAEVSSVVLQQALRDVESAYKNFFASLKGERKGPKVGAAALQVAQGHPAGDPVHHERPLENHRGRAAVPAEDRRGEGEVVAGTARHAVQCHGDPGLGGAVLRLVRHRHRLRNGPGPLG